MWSGPPEDFICESRDSSVDQPAGLSFLTCLRIHFRSKRVVFWSEAEVRVVFERLVLGVPQALDLAMVLYRSTPGSFMRQYHLP